MAKALIDFLGLKILRTKNLAEAKRSLSLAQAGLVEIEEKMASGFWRPLKISWRLKFDQGPVLDQIRSKRARKQIKTDSQKLASKAVELKAVFPLDEASFEEWLSFYQQKMGTKARGRLVIGRDWLAKKQAKGKKVGALLALREGKIIGGNLFYQVANRLSVAYGVAEKVDGLAGSLGLLLDYQSLVWAREQGYQEVSLGQDTNLYGFHLSPGLMFYKAKLGFRPVPATKTEWRTTFFLNFSQLSKTVMFFGGQEENLVLYVLGREELKEPPYLPLGIEKHFFFKQREILIKHQEIFND